MRKRENKPTKSIPNTNTTVVRFRGSTKKPVRGVTSEKQYQAEIYINSVTEKRNRKHTCMRRSSSHTLDPVWVWRKGGTRCWNVCVAERGWVVFWCCVGVERKIHPFQLHELLDSGNPSKGAPPISTSRGKIDTLPCAAVEFRKCTAKKGTYLDHDELALGSEFVPPRRCVAKKGCEGVRRRCGGRPFRGIMTKSRRMCSGSRVDKNSTHGAWRWKDAMGGKTGCLGEKAEVKCGELFTTFRWKRVVFGRVGGSQGAAHKHKHIKFNRGSRQARGHASLTLEGIFARTSTPDMRSVLWAIGFLFFPPPFHHPLPAQVPVNLRTRHGTSE